MRRAVAAASLAALVACGAADPAVEAPEPRAEAAARRDAPARSEAELITDFRKLWHGRAPVFQNRFLGISTLQNPFDAWVIQEILSEVKPDVFVEAGTYHGGSAVLWALLLTQLNPDARVVTIDIEDQREELAKSLPIARERVDFLLGSSTDPAIVAEVKRRVAGKKVVVMLDSLHTEEHVLAELRAYADLVGVGSYVIVQDTPVGGGAGVVRFLREDDRFVADRKRERFILTNSIGGYLRRVK